MSKTQELQRSPIKLSVKGLFRYPVKCFEWKTSGVARSCNYHKLRKSSRWSSSFVKCPAVFQIPAATNEQFVSRLSCRKFAGFHGQQFRRFLLNLVIQILFFCRFLLPEIEHSGTCFAINLNFVWFLTSHFPVVWCFDTLLFYQPIK